MRLHDIIRDAEALEIADKAFRDASPDWSGDVSIKWIDRTYYGYVRCWSISSDRTAFLIDPSLCKVPYARIPLETVARDAISDRQGWLSDMDMAAVSHGQAQ